MTSQESTQYFVIMDHQKRGPMSPEQLRQLGIRPTTAVWREGLSQWSPAGHLPEFKTYFQMPRTPALKASSKHSGVGSSPAATTGLQDLPEPPKHPTADAVHAAMHEASEVLGSFRKLDLKREVWPLNGTAARQMAGDQTFWWVMLLAVLPLLFNTLNDPDQMLMAFAMLFAGVWAMIFSVLLAKASVGWGWRLGCFFFTGFVGCGGLTLLNRIMPDWYVKLKTSWHLSVQLLGWVVDVGFWEELIKIVPVAIVAVFFRSRVTGRDLLLLGIFSGLGFAAFENIEYFRNQVVNSVSIAANAVASYDGTEVSSNSVATQLVYSGFATMLLPLVRSLSSPFMHAVWCGIFAHFVAVMTRNESKGRRLALFSCGWIIAASLHGLYDGLFSVQALLPVCIGVLSFMLLRVYLAASSTLPATPATQPSGPLIPDPPLINN